MSNDVTSLDSPAPVQKLAAELRADRMILLGTWMIALSVVMLALFVGWRLRVQAAAPTQEPNLPVVVITPPAEEEIQAVKLPPLSEDDFFLAVAPRASLHTIIPTRPRQEVITYTICTGDSIFGIAQKFNLKPETILWANYSQLNDDPDTISPGMKLLIPPVDGVLYEWKDGDSPASVASAFEAKVDDIMTYGGNKLDLTNPEFKIGQLIMVPGGHREFRRWIVPQIARGKAGVSKSVYGPGACEGSYDGAYGTGTFAWPIASHVLSGNDYWSGHLGIDIAAGVGSGVFASDSGVVVFSGWANGGYGYMIMIDHGNGYQTLYGHLSAVSARCGQSVYQGGYIGAAGSTGNSTGPHLHFEVRYGGGWINPWYVLPPP